MKYFSLLSCFILSMSFSMASSPVPEDTTLTLNIKPADVSLAVKLSDAAYYVDDGKEKIEEMIGKEGVDVIEGETGASYFSGLSAIGFSQQTSERLNLVFRGTVGLYDSLSNSLAYRSDFHDFGAVHSGYLSILNSFMDQVSDLAKDSFAAGIHDVLVAGHSMGGALAILAAMMLKNLFPKMRIHLITFNCPRVGNKKFHQKFGDIFGHANYARFVRGRDTVSSVNAGVLGNKHCGVEVRLQSYWNPFFNHSIASFMEDDVLPTFAKFKKNPVKIDGLRTLAIRKVNSSIDLLGEAKLAVSVGYQGVKGYIWTRTFELLRQIMTWRPKMSRVQMLNAIQAE